jgi:copper(I)-binding protein
VNRKPSRTSAVTSGLAACGFAAAVLLSGCGAGQISQSANQAPGINGTAATEGQIGLRNVHLRGDQTTDYIEPGQTVELLVAIANNSPDQPDRLVRVTSDVGTVTLTGDTSVPAGGILMIGEPDGQIAALESAEAADVADAEVALTEPISNGLTYAFTFQFEKAGETTVQVPISAGENPRRDAPAAEAGEGSDTGGHH